MMETNRTGRRFGRHNVAPLVKTASVLLGLSAILYVAAAPGEHALPFSRAASGSAPESRSANPEPATEALDPRPATGGAQFRNSPHETRERTDGPRECKLDAGIDSACTFN